MMVESLEAGSLECTMDHTTGTPGVRTN